MNGQKTKRASIRDAIRSALKRRGRNKNKRGDCDQVRSACVQPLRGSGGVDSQGQPSGDLEAQAAQAAVLFPPN
jgi:hypothetical protein